jgi:hypothetical protein
VAHDWINVPGWTQSTQVQSVVGRRKLWIATLINAIFPGVAVAFGVTFWNRPKPRFVAGYWVVSRVRVCEDKFKEVRLSKSAQLIPRTSRDRAKITHTLAVQAARRS